MTNNSAAATRSYGIPPPEFQLPDATHVGGVHLLVSDLERSLEFYEHVLGLIPSGQARGRVSLSANDARHPLITLHSRPGVNPARRGSFGLYHFAILLPTRADLGRFAAQLATLNVRIGMADHLVSEALYLSDPDGLGIEVYADRPRETWQHRDRELAMATDPLDLQDVIAAGAGQPWTKAPEGTTMGHVHLHVGNLDAAEAFYHRGIGLDKTVWSYPGALFVAAGGYHHHLGLNTWAPGPEAREHDAKLLHWELVVPTTADVARLAHHLGANTHAPTGDDQHVVAADPWGTRVVIRTAAA